MTEELEFKITLSGTYWDKCPEYAILIDGIEMSHGTVQEKTEALFTVAFVKELAEDCEHTLSIKLLNKTGSDTVENESKTAIVNDMLLNIVDIEIDGIGLEALKWTHSEYLPTHTQEAINNCVNLGWNGEWSIKFNSPFYLWLLENI